jgi:hypothetical protein
MPKLHYSRATTGEKAAECLPDSAARTDDGVRRLVLAAGARLGPGPVIVEPG